MGRAPGAVVSGHEPRPGWDAWLDDVSDHAQRLVQSAIGHDVDGLFVALGQLRSLHDDPRGRAFGAALAPEEPTQPAVDLRLSPPPAAPPPAADDLIQPDQVVSGPMPAPAPAVDAVGPAPEPDLDGTPKPPVATSGDRAGSAATTVFSEPLPSEPLPSEPLTIPLEVLPTETAGSMGSDGPVDAQPKRRITSLPGVGDRVFRTGSSLAGLTVLALMAAVGLLLFFRALQALSIAKFSFLTTAKWEPGAHHFGIAAILTGTVLIALVAMVVAVPFAIGTALFISEVAPRRIKGMLVSVVDLMAAVPSVVYGIWGLFYFQGHVIGLSRWISTWFSWIPLFRVSGADPTNPLANQSVYTASTFIAGLVVAMMAMPIACSVMREVFSQAPVGEREGAYALGATRWGMIRTVVLPFGKGGMIGGSMLGLGRALGETIAVVMIISPLFKLNFHLLQSGSNSVASLIALRYGDASKFGLSALMAAGLSLFVLTLVVNFGAATIVARSRSGAGSEA